MRAAPAALWRPERLFVGASVGLGALVMLCAVATNAYLDATAEAARTIEIRDGVHAWTASLLDAETGARGYLATGQPEFLEPYRAALDRERAEASNVSSLVAESPNQ